MIVLHSSTVVFNALQKSVEKTTVCCRLIDVISGTQ